jgi:hypothetical protein
MRVLALAGSLHQESYNRRLLQAAAAALPANMALHSWDGLCISTAIQRGPRSRATAAGCGRSATCHRGGRHHLRRDPGVQRLGVCASAWVTVQSLVAPETRTLAYDMAGLGGSTGGPRVRSLERLVADIRKPSAVGDYRTNGPAGPDDDSPRIVLNTRNSRRTAAALLHRLSQPTQARRCPPPVPATGRPHGILRGERLTDERRAQSSSRGRSSSMKRSVQSG